MEPNQPLAERARSLLQREGLDALLAYSNGTTSILKAGYFRYISGVKPLGHQNAALLTADGRAALLVTPLGDERRAGAASWIGDVRGSRDFAADLSALLKELGITGRVALAGNEDWPLVLQEAVQGQVTIVPGDALVEELSAVKTEAELAIARKCAWIADVAFEGMMKQVKVGMTEYEVVAEVEHGMREAGAEDVFFLLGTEPHNKAMHAPRDKRVAPGDVIICELSPGYEGLFVQVCRTISVGEPSPELQEKYVLLQRAQQAALEVVKAGVSAAFVSDTLNAVFAEAGYGEYCRPPYMRTRGHGFGFGSIKPGGRIDETTPGNLEHHQIIVLHPNQYLPDVGYLACGETILVTREGWEPLGETRSNLYSIPV